MAEEILGKALQGIRKDVLISARLPLLWAKVPTIMDRPVFTYCDL